MIIGVVNSKGGVGKSTIAVHLAVWAAERGMKTVLVDSDVQGSSSGWIAVAAPEVRLERLQTPDDVIEGLNRLAKAAGLVIVDGPAGLSEVTRAIMLCADRVLMPCGPSALDVRAADEALRALRQAQSIRNGPPLATFIPNKIQSRFRLSRQLLAAARDVGITVSPPLSLRQAFPDAAGRGSVVWRMGLRAAPAANEIKTLLRSLKL